MKTIGVVLAAALGACISPSGIGGDECGVMSANSSLGTEDALSSCNGTYQLVMQADGNLVLYDGYRDSSRATWATGTNGLDGHRADMQGDGNFVLYDSFGTRPINALWSSGTYGFDGAQLELTDGGTLRVTYNAQTLWSFSYGDRNAAGY
jgi:hypothetical protein